jgi:hypothetical protein
VASNAPDRADDTSAEDADDNDAAGKKTLVSAIAGNIVALVATALLAAFVYGRRRHCGGKDDNRGKGNDLAKAVPMLALVDNNIENLCNGGGNNDGNVYHGFYFGAAGGSTVGGAVGGKEAPGPTNV